MMNDYGLLGLMDTYKALKQTKPDSVPSTFQEFMAGLRVLPSSGLVARVGGTDRTV